METTRKLNFIPCCILYNKEKSRVIYYGLCKKSCVSHTEFVLFLFLHQWRLSLAKRFHASIGKMFGRGLQVQVQPCIERPYYFLYVRQTLGKSS